MGRRVGGNMPGRSGRLQSGRCWPCGADKRVVARANSGGKRTGLGHRNRVVPLHIASVLCTCVSGLDDVCDTLRSCYMDAFRNQYPTDCY